MNTERTLAWHFTGTTLRDGQSIPEIGHKLIHSGPVIPCQSGLHASVRIIDALQYAPGNIIHRVELSGEILPHENDKLAASERTILWSIDGESILKRFAREQALIHIDKWNAPEVVRLWLTTGDERYKSAAESAAESATARSAAWSAAESAARSAAWSAAESAAWSAAESAAWSTARSAASEMLENMIRQASGHLTD